MFVIVMQSSSSLWLSTKREMIGHKRTSWLTNIFLGAASQLIGFRILRLKPTRQLMSKDSWRLWRSGYEVGLPWKTSSRSIWHSTGKKLGNHESTSWHTNIFIRAASQLTGFRIFKDFRMFKDSWRPWRSTYEVGLPWKTYHDIINYTTSSA